MIYFFILLIILFGVFHYDYLKNKYGKTIYIIFCLISLGLMSAFRYRVGGDSIVYEDTFDYLPTLNNFWNYLLHENSRGLQPFWLLLNSIVRTLGGDVYDFQFLHALIFNSLLFIFLKNYTNYALTFLLLFFLSFLYFYYAFEIQRESIAVVIFLMNIQNLEKKRYWKYYLLAIFSFLFHVSALVIFFLPLFQFIKLKNNFILILVLIGLPLTLLKDFFVGFFSNFLFLDSMRDRAEMYSQGGFSIIGLLAFYFVRVILPLPFILKLNKSKNIKKNGILFGFLIFSVFAQIIVGFERFLNYFYIWLIVQFVNEIHSKEFLFNVIRKNFFRLSFYGMLFFTIGYKFLQQDNEGNYSYHKIFFPYEDKFNKIKNDQREQYVHKLWGW